MTLQFTNYRRDLDLPLEDTVRGYMTCLKVKDEDQAAVWALLAPLGAKREAGNFHRDHSMRVGLLACEIGQAMGWDPKALLLAGLLHDVGKALVPTCTLCATEKWTASDSAAMREHVMDGFRLLRDRFDFTAHVIAAHHTFQQGGYPEKLPEPLQPFSDDTKAKIKAFGFVLMIADVFDAMHRVNSATQGIALTEEQIKEKMLKFKSFVPELYEHDVFNFARPGDPCPVCSNKMAAPLRFNDADPQKALCTYCMTKGLEQLAKDEGFDGA